jgi:hypothetical protein
MNRVTRYAVTREHERKLQKYQITVATATAITTNNNNTAATTTPTTTSATEKTKLRGLSPRANYTDRATALVSKVNAYFYG